MSCRPRTALGITVCAAAMATVSALAAAGALRRAAARDSHRQPIVESWFEVTPSRTPARIERGRALFFESCIHCHGVDARGDEGPDLHALEVSDRYIANTITRGIEGEMPSFAKRV